MTEAAVAAFTFLKECDGFEFCFDHGNENHLRDSVAGPDGKGVITPIPARDKYLSLIIRVDQSDQISEHDAVLVAESGARQQHRSEVRIAHVEGDSRRDEMGLTRTNFQRRINAGAHIESGRTPGRILG